MSRRKFNDPARLLHDLLNRYEAAGGGVKLLAYADEDRFADVEARDAFVRILRDAETASAIEVVTRKVDGRPVFAHARLTDAAQLYAYLGREPAARRVDASLEALSDLSLPAAAGPLFDEIREAWTRGVRRFGLAPHDTDGLAAAFRLVQALAERAGGEAADVTDFRTFSRIAGADSKALERLITTVFLIFGRLYPEHVFEPLDAADFLATLGLMKMPQPLMLAGPISVDGMPLPRMRYHGIPSEEAHRITLSEPVDYLLTIENYVSFVRHVRELPTDRALVIYAGGFPARPHLEQIVRLASLANRPVWHWGDIDGGGIRIFAHLESRLAAAGIKLRAHLMNADLLSSRGSPNTKGLRTAHGPPISSALADLWRAIHESGLMLEQETIDPMCPTRHEI